VAREHVATWVRDHVEQRQGNGTLFQYTAEQWGERTLFAYPYLPGAPGIGKSRTLYELPRMLGGKVAGYPVVRVDVSFNYATQYASRGNVLEALVARVLWDLVPRDPGPAVRGAPYPVFSALFSRVCAASPQSLTAALSAWFTVRVPHPESDVVALLCIDEITKVPLDEVRLAWWSLSGGL
jgi:hypothetical protein